MAKNKKRKLSPKQWVNFKINVCGVSPRELHDSIGRWSNRKKEVNGKSKSVNKEKFLSEAYFYLEGK